MKEIWSGHEKLMGQTDVTHNMNCLSTGILTEICGQNSKPHLKVFLFLALAAILFSGAEPF